MNRLLHRYGPKDNAPALVAYLCATVAVGAVVIPQAMKSAEPLPEPFVTVLYLTLASLGMQFSVQFVDGNFLVLADSVVIAALWSYGPRLAVLVQIAALIIWFFTHKKAIANTLFNCAQLSLALVVGNFWVRLAWTNGGFDANPLTQIALILLSNLTFDLVSLGAVAGFMAIDRGRSFFDTFPHVFYAQRKKTFMVGYFLNAAGSLLAFHLGLAGLVFVFAGVFALWRLLNLAEELAAKSEEAETDALTGLRNVRYLEKWLDYDFPKLSPETDQCSFIFVDVDNLKRVNDETGHEAGDQALAELAAILRSVVRADDKVIRYGGDEFILICVGTKIDAARDIAERVISALSSHPMEVNGVPIRFGVSMGLASFPIHSLEGRDLVRIADKAMYSAKKFGGNHYRVAMEP